MVVGRGSCNGEGDGVEVEVVMMKTAMVEGMTV